MKVLGIDYGEKRIGLAVSDETKTLARELTILSPSEFWKQLATIVTEHEVDALALGWPLNMSGQMTQKTHEVAEFQERLEEKTQLPVHRIDERLTSVMAQSLPGGKKNVDSLAAQLILQAHLDRSKK